MEVTYVSGADAHNFNVAEEVPAFLNSVLDRVEAALSSVEIDINEVQTCLVIVDRTVSLLRSILLDVGVEDKEEWEAMQECFIQVLRDLHRHFSEVVRRPTATTMQGCEVERTGRPGRPTFYVQPEMLEDFLALGFSKQKIANMCGVSRWTIYRRIEQYNLQHLCAFSSISDAELDNLIIDYTTRHGRTTGQVLIS